MASETAARPVVMVAGGGDALWFLGTFVRVKLDGAQTGGRLGAFEAVLPRGAAPPLHSHPQDETFVVLDGELTAWVVEPELAAEEGVDPPRWLAERAQRCGAGAVVYAPGGTPHAFRVESDTVGMLTLSTPAGIEQLVRALGEPARWPWLQPPPEGPRAPVEKVDAVFRAFDVVVHGPPPPPSS